MTSVVPRAAQRGGGEIGGVGANHVGQATIHPATAHVEALGRSFRASQAGAPFAFSRMPQNDITGPSASFNCRWYSISIIALAPRKAIAPAASSAA